MAKCINCAKESKLISKALQVCLDCIRKNFDRVFPHIQRAHARSRMEFDLPIKPPKDPQGVQCNLCVNECRIPEGQRGYCGLRENRGGKLYGGGKDEGNLGWYYDHLPTNCVADWVCAGGSRAGYPEYSHSLGPEYGYKNLAVFYQACSFNCLFCQNWHFRKDIYSKRKVTAEQLSDCVDEKTSCICYFGGDPTPQIQHAMEASEIALSKNKGKILRICWETNGAMNPQFLEKMAGLSLKSGGCIKFDLKAFDENLNIALCGVTNKRTLKNFEMLSEISRTHRDPPFLVASTLLVPGYVDSEEISKIANFIASFDKDTPYSLLGFHPQFFMTDLPTTSSRHAEKSKIAAERAGLRNVRIGNIHLLGNAY
ncbi:MAG: radical SAM protein [candidate division Zixibacteria bacterium]|nr:radical SAM protein [candidate division Zixibacteria bacterium]